MPFNEDMPRGEKGERIITEFLETQGFELINNNQDNRYDLRMLNHNGNVTTLEVKTDFYCREDRDTGNIFVEKECRGKLSGVSVSQANWFITYFPHFNEAWFIKNSELQQLIEANNFYVATGGDPGSNTKGYLIKKENFREHFNIQEITAEWED